jgi:hypothetical protein
MPLPPNRFLACPCSRTVPSRFRSTSNVESVLDPVDAPQQRYLRPCRKVGAAASPKTISGSIRGSTSPERERVGSNRLNVDYRIHFTAWSLQCWSFSSALSAARLMVAESDLVKLSTMSAIRKAPLRGRIPDAPFPEHTGRRPHHRKPIP